ncbi:MAG TPA: hypothetical protein VNY53_06810 [Bradyrhizobium sp.]|jgi:hypothetical protein|nr:hypothetical protein [Bradyrhizobium sp.]
MFEEQGPDDMKSEFPSCIDECFYSSLEGSYFERELTKARDEKRMPVPYDPTRPVHTFWDIGMDDEIQGDGVRRRLIDFYQNTGEGLSYYVQVIREKHDQHAGGEFPRKAVNLN